MIQAIRFKFKDLTSPALNLSTLISLLILTFLLSSEAIAQGNLLITPKRVVFDGSKRSEDLNLVNVGKDTATYVISFIQNRMKEDGSFERITEPDSAQYFADKNLRFFPRTVTLAPNEVQTVKVQLTKSNELTPGEYRSHLYLRGVPKESPLGETAPVKDSGISVKIIPVFGISIPMIIRVGENSTQVTVSDVALQMEKDAPILKLTFNRTGNMSVYGDLVVNHISSYGKITRAGTVKGMAIYTPNALRKFQIALDRKAGIDFNNGKLQILFTDSSPKALKLAESEISLTNNKAVANAY